MMNIPLIESAMRKLGLNGSALAEMCDVSKESTSNWLKGESLPRPSKLARLASALQLSVESLLILEQPPQPIYAYRTKRNKPVTGELRDAADEQARHLEQLLPFVDDFSEFEPQVLKSPLLDDDYIRKAAIHSRESLNLSHKDVLTEEKLEALFHNFGAIFVPVLWGLNKERHENALTVYQPDSKAYWVIFNLGCRVDDYKYWLAHEFGHCLTLATLNEEDGEKFAEKFAQYLVFPDEVAHDCLEKIRKTSGGKNLIKEFAKAYGVSAVTVVKAVDRLSKQIYGEDTGLATKWFYIEWTENQKSYPTMTDIVVGKNTPTVADYIQKTETRYRTPVFKALQAFQESEGGRNPAFISKALAIGLGDALNLSHELWGVYP